MTPGSIGYIESLPKRNYDETKQKPSWLKRLSRRLMHHGHTIRPDIKAPGTIRKYLSKIASPALWSLPMPPKCDYIARAGITPDLYFPGGKAT
jgi:hypothetical protein